MWNGRRIVQLEGKSETETFIIDYNDDHPKLLSLRDAEYHQYQLAIWTHDLRKTSPSLLLNTRGVISSAREREKYGVSS
jgi:hypothetical protein